VLVRDNESREVVARIGVGAQGTIALAFSPRFGRLAIAPRPGRAAVYSPGAWDQPGYRLDERAAAITTLQFSPDDRVLAVGWDDGLIRQYAADTGAPLGTELHVKGVPASLQYAEAGQVLVVGTDGGELYFWEPGTGITRRSLKAHLARIAAIAPLTNPESIITAGRDRTLRLWNTRTGENVARFYGHNRQVYSLAVSPDGCTIASGAMEGNEGEQRGQIRLWRGTPGSPTATDSRSP
jgi:WD40 repeat protein